jgi:rhamnosyltransferase
VLKQAVDYLLIIDNTETGTLWLGSELEYIFDSPTEYGYITLLANLGIAEAQNIALRKVFNDYSDRDHVIFLDQDSAIDSAMPRQLAQAFERLNQWHDVAAVGPSFIDAKKGFTYPQVAWSPKKQFKRFIPNMAENEQSVCALISSGMVSSVKRLKEVGEFDTALFIDYVDIDWSLKAQSQGLALYVIPGLRMRHSIGSNSIRIAGRELSVHPAQRRYYMMRNSIRMFKKHYVNTRLGWSFIYKTLIHHLIIIALQPNRIEQIKALLRGMHHGLIGRTK